jgi:hypothetical protein
VSDQEVTTEGDGMKNYGDDEELMKRLSENEVDFVCARMRISWTWHNYGASEYFSGR